MLSYNVTNIHPQIEETERCTEQTEVILTKLSEIKRDNPRIDPRDIDYVGHDGMNSADIACELGYIGALLYAIKVEVANTMAYGYEHDHLRKDVQQCKDLVDHLRARVSV